MTGRGEEEASQAGEVYCRGEGKSGRREEAASLGEVSTECRWRAHHAEVFR